jgi:hypothetical protein
MSPRAVCAAISSIQTNALLRQAQRRRLYSALSPLSGLCAYCRLRRRGPAERGFAGKELGDGCARPPWRAISVHLAGIRGPPTTCQLARCLVTEYKFRIGQLVYFHPKRTGRSQVNAAAGPYQIVQRLPAAEDGEFHYEIRSAVEDHNRVARESELTPTR